MGKLNMYHKLFVYLDEPIKESGWGMFRVHIDNAYTIWMSESYDYFKAGIKYDFGEFVDTSCEFPVYFFKTFEECLQFCKTKSNRYPYDRAMYWLRFYPEYWFGIVSQEYIDYVQYLQDYNKYYHNKPLSI